MESIWEEKYTRLHRKYRNDIIDWEEEKTRMIYIHRQEMITNAQLHRELELARETIEELLSFKIDSRKLSTHSINQGSEIGII